MKGEIGLDKCVTWESEKLSKGMIASYKPFNFVDGEGIRHSLYVSGCPFACVGCYNKAAQNFSYGTPYTKELADKIIDDLSHPSVKGLTLLGGEPFLNTGILLPLCKRVKETFNGEKDIWSWTGYTYEQILESSKDKQELLTYIDILVDGKFMIELKNLDLVFRGSSNQRIIDVPKTLETNVIQLWNDGQHLIEEETHKRVKSVLQEKNEKSLKNKD